MIITNIFLDTAIVRKDNHISIILFCYNDHKIILLITT